MNLGEFGRQCRRHVLMSCARMAHAFDSCVCVRMLHCVVMRVSVLILPDAVQTSDLLFSELLTVDIIWSLLLCTLRGQGTFKARINSFYEMFTRRPIYIFSKKKNWKSFFLFNNLVKNWKFAHTFYVLSWNLTIAMRRNSDSMTQNTLIKHLVTVATS